MQRWQLTVGLAGLALGAAWIAPRLTAILLPQQVVLATVVTPPVVEVEIAAPPAVDPTSTGNLIVDVGLDRTAVMTGQTSERFLTVQVTAPEDIGETFRRPVDLAVVIDASGSMSARGKIDYAKRAAKLLATSMDPGDTYSLVTFNEDATTIVPPTRASDVASIHRAIDRIYEGGATNLYAGLDSGARAVKSSLDSRAVGRVVVLSDGHANVGITDGSTMARFAADLAADGVALSTIGLGLDYNEDLLAELADMGGGTYDFVNEPKELEAVFTDELARTASVVARSTWVEIALPDGVEPLEAIGWDAVRTPTGWRVHMGDVYSGQSRKIVTRVRVTAGDVGAQPMASVVANYDDLVSNSVAETHASAVAEITADARRVQRSVDPQRAAAASEAYGSWHLEMSTRAYADGDRSRSRELLRKGRDVLRTASRYDPSLGDAADELDDVEQVFEMHAPRSSEGLEAIKANKEMFRERSR